MNTPAFLRFRRLTVHGVLLALAPLALDGCLSINVDRTKLKTADAAARCSLEARLYEKGKDVKRDVKSTRPVTWKLFHLDTSPDLPFREGTGTSWSAMDLPPGKYRIAATWGPKPGVAGDTTAGSGEDTFSLKPGDSAHAAFVLSKFPTATVVGVGLGLVAVGAVAAALASTTIDLGHIDLGRSVSNRFTATGSPRREKSDERRPERR